MSCDDVNAKSDEGCRDGRGLSRIGRSMSHANVPVSHEEALKAMESQSVSSVPREEKHSVRKKVKKCVEDFTFGGILGEGAYAKVMQATLKSDGVMYAAKVVDKNFVRRHGKVNEMINEKTVLSMLRHTHIVRLHFTFQDEFSLYYIMDLAPNGELFNMIQTMGKLHVDMARVYAAELVNTLDYLRRKRIIHRDLKPENVLIGEDGHIKLTDFATSKIVEASPSAALSGDSLDAPVPKKRKNSFVGTAEYVTPELLNDGPVGFGVDLWALGCIIYQMLVGQPPFRGESEYLTFQKILRRDLKFPEDFDVNAKDLVEQLLRADPAERIGAEQGNGFEDIRAHSFFSSLDFQAVHKTQPPHFDEFVAKLTALEIEEKDSDSEDEDIASLTLSSSTRPKSEKSSSSKPEGQLTRQSSSLWSKFLDDGEKVIFNGQIKKRGVGLGAMFYKSRHLVLTDKPRFIYINMSNLQKKGDILWSAELHAEMRKEPYFYIHTPHRVYDIKASSCTAREWVEVINRAKEDMRKSSVNNNPL